MTLRAWNSGSLAQVGVHVLSGKPRDIYPSHFLMPPPFTSCGPGYFELLNSLPSPPRLGYEDVWFLQDFRKRLSAHLTKASRLKTPLIRTEASLILCLIFPSSSDCPPSPFPPAFRQFCNDYFICVDILSMCLSVLCVCTWC